MTNHQKSKLLKRGKILEFMQEDRSEIKKHIPKRGPKPKYVLKNGEVVKRRPGRPKEGDIFVGDDGVLYNSVPAKNPNIYRQSRFMEPISFGNGIDKIEQLKEEDRFAVIKELHSRKENGTAKDNLFSDNKNECSEQKKEQTSTFQHNNCLKPGTVISSKNIDELNMATKGSASTNCPVSPVLEDYQQMDGSRPNTMLNTEFDPNTLFRSIYPYKKPTQEDYDQAKALYDQKGLNLDVYGRIVFEQPKTFLSREELICLGVWLRKHLRTYDTIFITQVKVGISHPEDPDLYPKLINKITDVCMRKLTPSDLREMIKHCEYMYSINKKVYDDAPYIKIDDARYKLLNPTVKLERDSRKELSNVLLGILKKMITEENIEERKTCKYYYNEQRRKPKIFRVFIKKKFKEF